MAQINSLYEVLDNLLNLHRALYTLAQQKKDVLIRGDVDELLRITQTEQKLIKMIDTTEMGRIEAVRELSTQKGCTLAEGTLSDLIKLWTAAEEKAKLIHYRGELIRIVSELREANELNQQLLEQSLSFVKAGLDLITDSPEEDFIYKKPVGYAGNPSFSRSFVNKKA